MSTPDIYKCDYENSITNFPLKTTASVSESLYDSVNEPTTMTLQFATHSIAPQLQIDGIINEGTSAMSGSGNVSTAIFQNNKYNLYSVQIVKPTHNEWVIPSKSLNKEDLIIIFQKSSSISSNAASYIVIVLPLIRSGTNQPLYLKGLSDTSATPGEYSLKQCLPPKNSQFVYYATCLDGYTNNARTQTAYVFLAVKGILLSNSIELKNVGTVATLPFTSINSLGLSSINNTEFTKYVLSTRVLLQAEEVEKINYSQRVDDVNQYKCVPLDPERDIVDNQIRVDTESGKLLGEVLAERGEFINENLKSNASKQNKIAQMVEWFFGIAFAIIITFGIVYGSYSITQTPSNTPITTPRTDYSFVLIYGGIAALCIFIGLIIGVTVF